MLGVATPFDLIEDKINTFSDIGYSIELGGFKLESAKLPLAKGLKDIDNPEKAIAQILDWTGGTTISHSEVMSVSRSNKKFVSQTSAISANSHSRTLGISKRTRAS